MLNKNGYTLVLFVYSTHQLRCWWQHFVDEDEDRLLRCKLNSLPNNIHELANRQILRT